MVRALDPVLAWPHMLPLGRYKVHPRGVKLPGPEFRSTTHPDFIPGTWVDIRGFAGRPGRTFFGIGDRFGGEVKPHDEMTEDDLDARAGFNAVRGAALRSYLREAAIRLEREGLPAETDGPAATVGQPAPRRRNEAPAPVADRKAAIDAEWRNPDGTAP